MYDEIEELYRKESANNKLNRMMITIYIILYIAACLLGIFKYIIAIPLFMIFCIFCIKKAIEKELNIKLIFDIFRKDSKNIGIKKLTNEKDKKLLKKYLKQKKYYNERTLKILVEHYRILAVNKQSNFLTFISLAISILVAYIARETEVLTYITYVMIGIVIIIIIYWLFNQLLLFIKIYKGENDMYINLEEIFTMLLVEKGIEKGKKSKRKSIKIG